METEWVSCAERLPEQNESPVFYFWGWDELEPDKHPQVYEVWMRDGITQGFSDEGIGMCPWVTHWMPVIPPAPPSKS